MTIFLLSGINFGFILFINLLNNFIDKLFNEVKNPEIFDILIEFSNIWIFFGILGSIIFFCLSASILVLIDKYKK